MCAARPFGTTRDDRRRAGGRDPPPGARLRGRVCERTLAPGLSLRFAKGADPAANGERRSCSACSTTAHGWPAICSGTCPNVQRNIAHGLSQAMQKRGRPRAAMSDNGSAMTAIEISEGLARLSILHQTTLPYSPYQNGKQEALWGSVECRPMAMLEGPRRSHSGPAQRGDAGMDRA